MVSDLISPLFVSETPVGPVLFEEPFNDLNAWTVTQGSWTLVDGALRNDADASQDWIRHDQEGGTLDLFFSYRRDIAEPEPASWESQATVFFRWNDADMGPRRAAYRHMRIKGDWGNDDFASMEEVVRRYFRRRRDEDKPLPDLVVIDGGKGQLSAAMSALASLELEDVAVIALAKREEEVFVPGSSDPILLDRRNRALHLLQRIRDEAHRFAVRYNRKLRRKRTIRSELGDIPGIGPQRQRVLLRRFGSIKGLRQATRDEIARIPGFSEALASRVLTYLGG